MFKTYQMNGYNLHINTNPKFKNIAVSIKMMDELKEEEATKRSLISHMFMAGTNKYPNTKKLCLALEELYSASMYSNVVIRGKASIINLNFNLINEKFLPNAKGLLNSGIELLSEVVLDPYLMDNAYEDEAYQIAQNELHQKIIGRKDDKFILAFERCQANLSNPEHLAIQGQGKAEEIENITAKELYNYYKKVLQSNKIDIFVSGDIDIEEIKQLCTKYFNFSNKSNNFDCCYKYHKNRLDENEIIEFDDTLQAKLVIAYETKINFLSENHTAFSILNMILGGISTSKLFMNVREKHSLCYDISSSYDAFNGLLYITAGIDEQSYDQAVSIIKEEIENLKHGNISDDELNAAIASSISFVRKTYDDQFGYIVTAYNRIITNRKENLEQYIEKLQAITKEDVIASVKNIELDTIYLLKGNA